jgi:translation initiation factor eIF-2B subunit delta
MDWIETGIEQIVRDRRHGAAQLASRAIRLLMAVCHRSQAKDLGEFTLEFKRTSLALARARPSMAPIRNWCLVFTDLLSKQIAKTRDVQETKRQGFSIGQELLRRQLEFVQRQVEAAEPLLKGCRSIVTLSYSSTVEAILRRAAPADCRVSIAESRPLMEGRRLFKRLRDGLPDLRMTTDAQMGLLIPSADLVLVGADTILRDLAVVNKVGTYLAALVARAHSRDFYVAADTYKIDSSLDSRNCELEVKPGKEVWPSQEDYCDNVYFDITPGHLVTGFVSEEGILDAAGISGCIQRWSRLEVTLEI